MGTPYDRVYQAFLDKVSDYDMTLMDETANEEQLRRYLTAACSVFGACRMNLAERDDRIGVFSEELSDAEADILAECMVAQWLKPKLHTTELMHNVLGSKDFTIFSPMNLMAEIRKTYAEQRELCERMIRAYSVSGGDIEKWRPKR